MTNKIITIEDIEFKNSSGGGSLQFYETPEFEPYNKHFRSSTAYLVIDKVCYRIIKWDFAEDENIKDDRFPQYDVFLISNKEFAVIYDSKVSIDLTEQEFKEWLIREQLPII